MRGNEPTLYFGDLKGFFVEKLSEVANQQEPQISSTAIDYVAEVLMHFLDAAKLFEQEGVKVPVLADMLAEAMEADFYRRISILRQMGDTSLLVSGYFPEALSRRSINLNYYKQMGEIAYSHLSGIIESQNVFSELSSRFIQLTELIEEVSTQVKTEGLSTSELLEYWSKVGSERVREKLKEQGVVPLSKKDV